MPCYLDHVSGEFSLRALGIHSGSMDSTRNPTFSLWVRRYRFAATLIGGPTERRSYEQTPYQDAWKF